MFAGMELDDAEYRLKPMNCPGHILIYRDKLRSYRELPVRLGELGTVYRYERSGVMHGLMRVRGFTQDDAHIFCTPEQIEDEVVSCLEFATRRSEDLRVRAVRGGDFDLGRRRQRQVRRRGGASGTLAENALKRAAERLGIKAPVIPDEAAFYGPKIDVKLLDALGRKWQLSTVQFDFTLPRRFDLEYVAEDGKRHQPLMVHRALYGSVERFFGILIEHYAGAFPVWLAPVQAVVMPITDRQAEYAKKVHAKLEAAGFRVASRRSQGESESQDSRRADAEGAVHAGGGRPRSGGGNGVGAASQARGHGRQAAGAVYRGCAGAGGSESRERVERQAKQAKPKSQPN